MDQKIIDTFHFRNDNGLQIFRVDIFTKDMGHW